MTTWTFAGDESGDVSFRFDRGATSHFVIAIIGTQQPETLRQALADLRRRYSLPGRYEFSFHGTTSRRLRAALFDTVARLDFSIWAVVADKVRLPHSFRVMSGQTFYVYFVTETIRLIPEEQRAGNTLLLDRFDEAGKAITALKRGLKARDIPKGFKRIRSKRSHGEALIQVADLAAGAILRKYAKKDERAFQAIRSKIDTVWMYHEKPPS